MYQIRVTEASFARVTVGQLWYNGEAPGWCKEN